MTKLLFSIHIIIAMLCITNTKGATDPCQKSRENGVASRDASVPAPQGLLKTPIGEIPTSETFRAVSGFYCDTNEGSFPTIYAQGGNKLEVVGLGYEREYDIGDMKEAIEFYRTLLVRQGYAPAMRNLEVK